VFSSPKPLHLQVHSELHSSLVQPRSSAWGQRVLMGVGSQHSSQKACEIGCFLEGPVFDAQGNLYVVDIPFGRILKLDPKGNWSVVVEYDGWPNGMKLRDGDFLVADHKLGLVQITPSGSLKVLLGVLGGRPLHGLNDLTVVPDGSVYTTDQGQTGMHDPTGRVIKCGLGGNSTVLIDNGPSPNGVVFDSQRGWLYVAMTRSNAIWRVPLMGAGVGRVGTASLRSGSGS
jgi:gluconolactonase